MVCITAETSRERGHAHVSPTDCMQLGITALSKSLSLVNGVDHEKDLSGSSELKELRDPKVDFMLMKHRCRR